MERCIASDEILVGSDSSTKKYTVSFQDVLPTCTCVSFAIGRNKAKARVSGRKYNHQGNVDAWCKHIDRVYEDACRWRGNTLIPGMCPECGGPTEPVNNAGVPTTSPRPRRTVVTSEEQVAPDTTSIEASLREWTNG